MINHPVLRICRLSPALVFVASLVFAFQGAAQTDIAPELLDRPPIAAPTSVVDVGAIPLVLSESQEVNNYVAGLLQGLMAGDEAKGIAIIAVNEDRVMLQQNIGSLGPETPVSLGALDLFETVAAMQLIERQSLKEDQDMGEALGEPGRRNLSIAQVLTRQKPGWPLLQQTIAKRAGTSSSAFIAKNILQPLGMSATSIRGARLTTTLADMSHLASALSNGGAFGTGRILESASAEQMLRPRLAPHPALPGVAFGLVEMRRNGRSALHYDAIRGAQTARMVVVQEAKIAYVIIVDGHPRQKFWNLLDNAVFDRLTVLRNSAPAPPPAGDPPSKTAAQSLAGTYEPVRDEAAAITSLKRGLRLRVRAGDEGSLILSGAENETLTPRPGGYWGSGDGNLNAVARGGRLVLSTGAFAPLAPYKRAGTYVALALLTMLGAAGTALYNRRSKHPSAIVPVLRTASMVFLAFSVLVWLLSPVA